MSEPSPCPICEGPAEATSQAFPFCSSRCRLIDIGRWADGEYAVASASQQDEPEDEALEAPEPEDDPTS